MKIRNHYVNTFINFIILVSILYAIFGYVIYKFNKDYRDSITISSNPIYVIADARYYEDNALDTNTTNKYTYVFYINNHSFHKEIDNNYISEEITNGKVEVVYYNDDPNINLTKYRYENATTIKDNLNKNRNIILIIIPIIGFLVVYVPKMFFELLHRIR